MPERRHCPPLDQAHALGPLSPVRIALPREFRAPAELACRRREPPLQGAAQTRLRPDAAHQHDLAARPQHAGKFIEGRLWVRHRVDDVMRDRKSTRLNSSHSQISYAVFCLKKKKKCITIMIFAKKNNKIGET